MPRNARLQQSIVGQPVVVFTPAVEDIARCTPVAFAIDQKRWPVVTCLGIVHRHLNDLNAFAIPIVRNLDLAFMSNHQNRLELGNGPVATSGQFRLAAPYQSSLPRP